MRETPDVLVDTARDDFVEPARTVNESLLALRDDPDVRGMPRNPEACTARETVRWLTTTAVRAHPIPVREIFALAAWVESRRQYPRWYRTSRTSSVVRRCLRGLCARGRVTVSAGPLGATLSPLSVIINDPALQHCGVGLKQLTDRPRPNWPSREDAVSSGSQRGVAQVEVFRRMGSVESILKDLAPYPRTSRTPATTPLKRDDPVAPEVTHAE